MHLQHSPSRPPPIPADLAADTLDPRHFAKLAEVVEERIGIRLPAQKRMMVEGRLRRPAREAGFATLLEYGTFLFSGGGLEGEFDKITDAVTTNKTDFFREAEHFAVLAQTLIPALLARRDRRPGEPIRLWSAACSTGAEAYTLAMVMAALETPPPGGTEILGTDICTDVLQVARRAIYPDEMLDPIPAEIRRRYTMASADRTAGIFRIVPELRRMARFQHLNLMAPRFEVPPNIDVVFCRNVLIYFSLQVQRRVVASLMRHMRPGGFLILGHAEPMVGNEMPGLKQVLPTVFQLETATRLA